jgi:cysteine-rich repeat protein
MRLRFLVSGSATRKNAALATFPMGCAQHEYTLAGNQQERTCLVTCDTTAETAAMSARIAGGARGRVQAGAQTVFNPGPVTELRQASRERQMNTSRLCGVTAAAAVALLLVGGPAVATATDACIGLKGAAYGLCDAYCNAQDCAEHARPACSPLRTNFAKLTGQLTFPCDAVCGDGKVNRSDEECDDGNTVACDGCSPTCQLESCGDGYVCPPEQCEPGQPCADGGECQEDCTCHTPVCGDNLLDAGEQCDDGNTVACDGCSPTCQLESCGDGTVCLPEACEPGDVCADGQACQADCSCPAPLCGNGSLDPGEDCDPLNDTACPGLCQPDCRCAAPLITPCGAASAPQCDGACPSGLSCVPVSDGCGCAFVPFPCGGIGAPVCLGACPPSFPICRDTGGVCQCTAF